MRYCLAGIIALLLAGPAMGVCDVPRPRLVCAEYFASKVVVEATLVKVRTIGDKDDPISASAYVYSLHADRVIRGNIAAVFHVYEENDSGRAAFDWQKGRKYLLFLFYISRDKSWELDGCGNSGPVNNAQFVLKQIHDMQSHHDGGVIHGVVSQETSDSISGVRVEARGTNRLHTATTNAQGEFEIKVPAGRYAIRAMKTGFVFDTADFSYENPHRLKIEPGGCAQIQLVARSALTSLSRHERTPD